MIAMYDGVCPACKRAIEADVSIIVTANDGSWMHERCRPVICGRCFMTKPCYCEED